jgi:hypothetical protein
MANTVETLFGAVAAGQGAHLPVLDVRPLPAADRSGESLFFLLIGWSIAGFLTITAAGALAPALRQWDRWPLILAPTVATPVLAYLLAGLRLGAITGSAGVIFALLEMGTLYVLIVGTITRGPADPPRPGRDHRVPGHLSSCSTSPSAGGAISPVLLPTFWHVLNRFWIDAAAFEAFRSVIYFGGQGVGTDVLKLLAWLAVAVVLLALPVWRKIGPGRGGQAPA